MLKLPDLVLPEEIAGHENLPSMPGVVVKILQLAKDEQSGIQDFSQVISGDPALTLKLLKLSNSSMFSTGHEVKTLDRACMVLGLKTVQLMALSFSLRSSLPEVDGDFLKEYWARSLICAVAGRAFSRYLNHGLDDEAFLCGLLNQAGHLVLLECMPDEYRRVQAASGGAWPSAAIEREVLGFDCTTLAAALLKTWGLPLPVYLSVLYSHQPNDVPSDVEHEVQKVSRTVACGRLTAELFRGHQKGESLDALHKLAARIGLAEVELSELLDGLGEEVSETAKILEVQFESDYSAANILEDAREQVMRISLGAAADLHQAERRAHTLESENRELTQKLTIDELTGVTNRAGLDQVLAQELELRATRRKPKALGLLMVDVDHFKRFNDTYGHRAGDEVLRSIGRILDSVCRGTDLPARYGGEEFAVIAPEVTPAGLGVLAERLRQAIEAHVVDFEGKQLEVTASIGGACIAESLGPENASVLVEDADACLYEAKRSGRNRCVVKPDLIRVAAEDRPEGDRS